jgi:hypothetical protein
MQIRPWFVGPMTVSAWCFKCLFYFHISPTQPCDDDMFDSPPSAWTTPNNNAKPQRLMFVGVKDLVATLANLAILIEIVVLLKVHRPLSLFVIVACLLPLPLDDGRSNLARAHCLQARQSRSPFQYICSRNNQKLQTGSFWWSSGSQHGAARDGHYGNMHDWPRTSIRSPKKKKLTVLSFFEPPALLC